MDYIHSDLGQRHQGEVVKIELTNGANVRLMNATNFSSYKLGKKHSFYGGLAKKSPVIIDIPNSGHWYVAVDMQGLRGTTRASISMMQS